MGDMAEDEPPPEWEQAYRATRMREQAYRQAASDLHACLVRVKRLVNAVMAEWYEEHGYGADLPYAEHQVDRMRLTIADGLAQVSGRL